MRTWTILVFVVSEILATSTLSASVTSFLPTFGPILPARSYIWRKVYTPVIVGTVIVTVNEATNKTTSTTSYHNATGTRTAQIDAAHITYPANYFTAASELTWTAILPFTATGTYNGLDSPGLNAKTIIKELGESGTCCYPSITVSPTPSHTPFKQTSYQSYTQLEGKQVSLLFLPTPLTFQHHACTHAMCTSVGSIGAGAASAVPSVMGIFATSSTTVSIDDEALQFSTPLPPLSAASLPLSIKRPQSPTRAPAIETDSGASNPWSEAGTGSATVLAISHTAETSVGQSSSAEYQTMADNNSNSDSTSTTTLTRTSTRISYITIEGNSPSGTARRVGPISGENQSRTRGEVSGPSDSAPLHFTITRSPSDVSSHVSFTAMASTTADRDADLSSDLRSNMVTTPQTAILPPAPSTLSQPQTYTSVLLATQSDPSMTSASISVSTPPGSTSIRSGSTQMPESAEIHLSVENTRTVSSMDNPPSSTTPTGLDTPSSIPTESLESRVTTSRTSLSSSSGTIGLGRLISQGLAPSNLGSTPATASKSSVMRSSSADPMTNTRLLNCAVLWMLSLWLGRH